MNGLYAEAGVKKRPTFATFAAKSGLILLVVIIFLAAILFSGQSTFGYILMMIACVLVAGLFYILPKFNIDYEYIFCDGQLDFDVITGGNKRKTSLRIDFEGVEIMAPEKSHALDSYSNQTAKVRDFSSHVLNQKRYVIYFRKGDQLIKIIFEPNDKMLQYMKQKAPRKLVEF